MEDLRGSGGDGVEAFKSPLVSYETSGKTEYSLLIVVIVIGALAMVVRKEAKLSGTQLNSHHA
jgi:hypothetical protein